MPTEQCERNGKRTDNRMSVSVGRVGAQFPSLNLIDGVRPTTKPRPYDVGVRDTNYPFVLRS